MITYECAHPMLPRKRPTQLWGHCGVGRCKGCRHLEPGPVLTLQAIANAVGAAAGKEQKMLRKRIDRDTKTVDRLEAVQTDSAGWFTTADASKAWGVSAVNAREWLYGRFRRHQVEHSRGKIGGIGMPRDLWRARTDPGSFACRVPRINAARETAGGESCHG